MLRNRNVLLLISLLIAIGVWIYVMGNVDPLTTLRMSNVEVEMEGVSSLEAQDLHPTLNSPETVTVTLEGKRSQINKVKKNGIVAYIDVSTCEYGKNETKINITLPDGVTGVTVEEISERTAVFTVK